MMAISKGSWSRRGTVTHLGLGLGLLGETLEKHPMNGLLEKHPTTVAGLRSNSSHYLPEALVEVAWLRADAPDRRSAENWPGLADFVKPSCWS